MSNKPKKVCTTLTYVEQFIILVFAITGCISISAFTSLVGIRIWIASSAIGLKIYAITAEIKKYKTIIKKRKNKHDKIVLLAKTELNSVAILIFKALINSDISHNDYSSK